MGFTAIEKKLRHQGIKFSKSAISNLLRSEKYIGDMLLQKTFTLDHISKKQIKNEGQMPQYYVQNSHEPIVSLETFAAVQEEIKRRAEHFPCHDRHTKTYPFTGKIVCGKCGAHYRRKITASGTKYEKAVWICGTFNTYGKEACDSQQIPEEILIQKSAEIMNLGEGFSDWLFPQMIKEIQVPEPGKLVFVFYTDAPPVEVTWKHESRSKSWTPEMREAARQRQLKRLQHVKEAEE